VEIIIPLRLEVPDAPIAFADLARCVQDAGRAAVRAAYAAAWVAQLSLSAAAPCPHCGHTDTHAAGRKPRRIETPVGAVTICRPRRQCAACGRRFQPGDDRLRAALGGGQLSPALRELAVLCGASWPDRQAATVLGMLRGEPLAPETVRAIVAGVGGRIAAAQEAEAANACQPDRTADPAERLPPPDELVAELDGAWVGATDAAQGREVKVGGVHAGSEPTGRVRRALVGRRYVATMRGVRRFEQRLTAAITRVNGFNAPEQTVRGDGAGWIWRVAADNLPEAVSVLDRWHLREERRRALRAAIPLKEERAPWSERVETALDRGDVPAATAAIREVQTFAPHQALEEFVGYLVRLAPQIPDYAARRAAGQRCGSGGAEKGCDALVNRRGKGKRGMRWSDDGLEAAIALRLDLLNDDLATYATAWHSPLKRPAI
jgi:uncharacterized protein UPF0236